MKKYFFVVFMFITGYTFAQTSSTYFVKFTSQQTLPTVSALGRGTVLLSFPTQGKIAATTLEASVFEQEFSNFSSPSLQNVYRLTISDTESSKLQTLVNNAMLSTYEELEGEGGILSGEDYFAIPNDYYLNSDPSAHTYLDLINAQEAWDYSTGDNVTLGVPDFGFNLSHLELVNKATCLVGTSCFGGSHGSQVSGLVAAETNNLVGNAAIGYNADMIVFQGNSVTRMKTLSDMGVKAINMSWYWTCSYSQFHQDAINEISDQGTVLIAAAGNGSTCGGPTNYIYPAAYDNVISVSGVGHSNDIGSGQVYYLKDVHLMNVTPGAGDAIKSQHHDDVDLVGPAYYLGGLVGSSGTTSTSRCWNGTSCSAPLVTGTVGLMLDANDCISPQEVEDILKITSADIDHISYNQPYAGLLGAGRLDAGLAVKAAYKMKNNQLVTFSNKKINRFDLKLDNTLYEVELEDVEFTGDINLELIAEKSITLSDGAFLSPDTSSSNAILLDVDGISNKCYTPMMSRSSINTNSLEKKGIEEAESIKVYPTLFTNYVFVNDEKAQDQFANIYIYDINKRVVYKKTKVSLQEASLNLSSLKRGMYILEIDYSNGKFYQTKLFKQ
jgi:hypothetical protein